MILVILIYYKSNWSLHSIFSQDVLGFQSSQTYIFKMTVVETILAIFISIIISMSLYQAYNQSVQ